MDGCPQTAFSCGSPVFGSYPSIRDSVQFPVILFIDGHSSHNNEAVSEFRLNRQIILYCFPGHSSHILQPLDVTVFGPLKKYWNSAINDYKSQHREAVTKHKFFQVFDGAWKKCVDKNHAVIGFRSTGLVPFNANAVDYTKVLVQNSGDSQNKHSKSDRSNFNADQRIGISRTFQVIKGILSQDQVNLFERRIEEDYNIVDDTDNNKLWRIYKTVKIMQNQTSENETNQCPGPEAAIERNGSQFNTPVEQGVAQVNSSELETSNSSHPVIENVSRYHSIKKSSNSRY